MRRFILCFSVFAVPVMPVLAEQHAWLTMVGNPQEPKIDTVQVDAMSIMGVGDLKLIKLRASRQSVRTSPLGIQFRSFEAIGEIDCISRTARYVRTTFFGSPLWQSPIKTVDYGSERLSVMAFRGIEPNPTEKIVRAACLEN